MIILCAPTKTMHHLPSQPEDQLEQNRQACDDQHAPDIRQTREARLFASTAEQVYDAFMALSAQDRAAMWGGSSAVVAQAERDLQRLVLHPHPSDALPALDAFQGLQFARLDVASLAPHEREHLLDRLYIVSALYGLLRGFEPVLPYRLDFSHALTVPTESGLQPLHKLWRPLVDELVMRAARERTPVLNLCSKEYTKPFTPALLGADHVHHVRVGTLKAGSEGRPVFRVGATVAKMARGLLLRAIAQHQLCDPSQLREVPIEGFRYVAELSDRQTSTFVVAEP